MSKLTSWFGGRGRYDGNSAVVMQIAREVVERRRSVQGALNEVRHPAVLDSLSDEDFRVLDEMVEDNADYDPEYAIVLARLTHAAARAKGFDRQIVDAALSLDALLPPDDPSREREQLLRDAYVIAQRAGYVRGGRLALARLGMRAAEADEFERARILLSQQLDIADESTDSAAEVDSSLLLGDILKRAGDTIVAQSYYRRASRSAARLDYHRGVAEALVRQIDLMDAGTSDETLAALQRQALDAAQRTADLSLQSRIVLALAETLARSGRIEEVVPQLEMGVNIAQQIGDLSVESRCLMALIASERRLGRLPEVAEHQRQLVDLEERLGNRSAAATWAVRLGMSYLDLGHANEALQAFSKARTLATSLGDLKLEQRALGGIGASFTMVGRPADALDNLMQALDLARRSNDLVYEAQWLASIGQALWKFNQPEDALRALTEGLGIARRIDDGELQSSMLTLLGQIHASAGQIPRARECYHRALELSRRLGQASEEIHLLSALAGLALDTRQLGQATALYDQALHIAVETSDRVEAARLHGRLGRIAQSQRDFQDALDHYRRAVDLAETVDQPALLKQSLLHLATAQHAVGDHGAVHSYRRSLTLAQQAGDVRAEALVRLNLGLILTSDGSRDEGLNYLYRAAALAAELGPEGTALVQQADEAIAEYADVRAAEPQQWPAAEAARGEFPLDDAYDRDAFYEDDEIYEESTLPPH
ncbi:MAG: tetratricopeptide repeat protein [Thermomicrobiales bacterium]